MVRIWLCAAVFAVLAGGVAGCGDGDDDSGGSTNQARDAAEIRSAIRQTEQEAARRRALVQRQLRRQRVRMARQRAARRAARQERRREAAAAAAAAEEAESAAEPTTSCDPNYSGACLDPNASDYDCAGGSGDGPDYTGPVTVVGSDPHGLDSDGDGQGCEP